jgi:hypothetical protein
MSESQSQLISEPDVNKTQMTLLPPTAQKEVQKEEMTNFPGFSEDI